MGGYAVAQIKKSRGLGKKMNWEKESMVRKTPIDFCYVYMGNEESIPLRKWLEIEGYSQSQLGLAKINNVPNSFAIYLDYFAKQKNKNVFQRFLTSFFYNENKVFHFKGIVKTINDEEVGNELTLSSIPKGELSVGLMTYNVNGYQSHCKVYKSYKEWLKNRNTARYVDIETHGQSYDGKNLLHVRRLLDMSIEMANGEGIIVRRPNAKALLDIRKGNINLEELYKQVELDLKLMDVAFDASDLPEKIEDGLLERILTNIRKYQLDQLKYES